MPGYHWSNRAVAAVRRRRPAAYTLLELMIVLAIMTTIAGLSWPALMRPWSRSLSQQAAQQLARELMHARTNAIEQSRIYEVRWEQGGRAFEVRPLDGSWPSERPPISKQTANEQTAEDDGADDLLRAMPAASPSRETPGRFEAGEQFGSINGAANEFGLEATNPGVSDELPAGVRFAGAANGGVIAASGQSQQDPLATDGLVGDRLLSPDGSLTVDPSLGATDTRSLDPDGASLDEAVTLAVNARNWSPPVRFYPDGRSVSTKWTLSSDDGYEVDVTLRGLTGLASIGRIRTTWTPPGDVADETAPEADDDLLANDEAFSDPSGKGSVSSSVGTDRSSFQQGATR